MCLTLKNNSVEVQIAKKDIVVYKRLRENIKNRIKSVNNGNEFTGVIKDVECSGKIHKTQFGEIFFCTNDARLNGSSSPDKLGYSYSWIMDKLVTSIVVNDIELIYQTKLETPYRHSPIEIGETYTSELIKEFNTVERGLHSFAKLKDAKGDGNGVYVKCIIPKGSKYYKGEFDYCDSYASDKLTYVEICK